MKIYKLDIDTSKPTRQVVAMQQNSTGMLSVDVANDGKYIRNLSCSLYEDGNEISATTENGYKIDMGDETKVVKFKAKSAPYDSVYTWSEYTHGNRSKQVAEQRIQIKPGVYNQDEFLPCLKMVSNNGVATIWPVHGFNLSATNFDRIIFRPWNPHQQIWFIGSDGKNLPVDEMISAASEISVYQNIAYRYAQGTSISSFSKTWPTVGYYTDYQMDTIIKPTTNAACYAEYDIAEPTPETPDEPSDEPQE